MTREVVLTPASEIPPYRPDWGPWVLRADNMTLEVWPDGDHYCAYYVDLEECLTSAEVLDHIAQVSQKRWAECDPRVIAGLVTALDDVLNLQANLCPCGRDTSMTRAEVAEMVQRAVKRWPHLLIHEAEER